MATSLPDDVRDEINEAISGPLPNPGTPEYEAEIERRLEAAETIQVTYETTQAQAAYTDLVSSGINEETASHLTGYTPPSVVDGP